MAESVDRDQAATRARVAACGLALGRSVDMWSLALTALALVLAFGLALQSPPLACLLVVAVAGGVQKAFALRVAFDEALFRTWADRWSIAATANDQVEAATAVQADLLALDQALAAMGLRRDQPGCVRDLDRRIDGARRLFGWQLMALAIQTTAWILAILALHLRVSG